MVGGASCCICLDYPVAESKVINNQRCWFCKKHFEAVNDD